MIYVSMGEEKVVDLLGLNGPLCKGNNLITPLSKAAINQDVEAIGLEKVTGTGYGIFAAKVGDRVHWVV